MVKDILAAFSITKIFFCGTLPEKVWSSSEQSDVIIDHYCATVYLMFMS
jgi:hypothetical protein